MKKIIKAAAAVPTVRPANVVRCTENIIKKIDEARDEQAELLLFPELSLCGVSGGDLLGSELLCDAVISAVAELEKKADGIAFVLGAPIRQGGRIFNCALYFADGKLQGIVPKQKLGYEERRVFSPACDAREDKISLLGREIPFGAQLRFDFCGLALAISVGDSEFSAVADADIVVCPTAIVGIPRGRRKLANMAETASARDGALYIVASAGCDESTADCVYSGGSLIACGGKILKQNSGVAESDYILTAEVQIDQRNVQYIPKPPEEDSFKIKRTPFVPTDRDELRELVYETLDLQAAGLARRLRLLGCRPVLGISGGLDSTLALLVCLAALDRLGRPASDLLGITMPCFGTSGDTLSNSLALMQLLGVEGRTVRIGDTVKSHLADIGHSEDKYDAAYENAQARERTQVLMDIANMVGGIVIGTGDLSELALGWCTYNGDQMSMYSVNASLPKTLIREMVRVLADDKRFVLAREPLLAIVDQPISPELVPPDKASGKIAQKTEDIVGPYELHDFFLYYFMRYGCRPRKLYEMALSVFEGDYGAATVKYWLSTFFRRFFSQQFKRSVAPDGASVGPVSLSPRGGWCTPSDADGEMWVLEAALL